MASDASVTTADSGISAARATDFKVSEGYRKYVLWLLLLVYVFNFVDRSILTILMQPIKE